MLHKSDKILRFIFENNITYTILVEGDDLYLLSIVSEMNYNKMYGKLPTDYLLFDGREYNSFRFVGKKLPPLLISDREVVMEMLADEWSELQDVKTKFSISVMSDGLSVT